VEAASRRPVSVSCSINPLSCNTSTTFLAKTLSSKKFYRRGRGERRKRNSNQKSQIPNKSQTSTEDLLLRKNPLPKQGRHSGESRNPGFFKAFWTPAFAGVTAFSVFQQNFGLRIASWLFGISLSFYV
jgi:hypothetical protein